MRIEKTQGRVLNVHQRKSSSVKKIVHRKTMSIKGRQSAEKCASS